MFDVKTIRQRMMMIINTFRKYGLSFCKVGECNICLFALWLTLGLRIGLSLWMGAIWATVDRYLPWDADWMSEGFARLTPHASLVGRMFFDVWTRWDGLHYLQIAKFGYYDVGLGEMNFFPLYPWIVRLVSWIVPGGIIFSSLIVSTVATWFAIVLFYKLVIETMEDSRLAKTTVMVWALYPTSVFLFAPFTDALFASLTLGSLLAIRRRWWLVGGCLAALAALTRGQGILLVIPMAFEIIRQIREGGSRGLLRMLTALAIVPVGWLGFMVWRQQRGLVSIAGSFSAYSGVYFADPLTTMVRAIQQAVVTGELRVYLEVFSLLGFGVILIWMLTQKKYRRQVDLMSYSIATLGLFLVKHSQVASVYQSATRYVLSLFPIFIGLAALVLKLPPKARKLYWALSLSGLLVVSTFYTLFFFVG